MQPQAKPQPRSQTDKIKLPQRSEVLKYIPQIKAPRDLRFLKFTPQVDAVSS